MHRDGDVTVTQGLLTRLSRTLQAAWRDNAAWLVLLLPLSAVHRAVSLLRRELFRRGWRSVYRAPVPVIVVGNITVGGTGKTPVVIALAHALRARGVRVGIVSRGYGASRGAFPRRVRPGSGWRDSGDEPLMTARQTGCPVVIAPRRADAVRELLQWQSVDLVISDDGLQHLALARDLDIVLLDATAGVGNGRLLPAGPLREPAARLAHCDWVLQRDSSDPARHFRYRIDGLVHLQTGAVHPADAL
ncbi:MAG: tetraacyldisaccharide 4'-kinase, partial [Chromatocurvus sp.]